MASDNQNVDLPKTTIAELEQIKAALPAAVFVGRVPEKGPRKTWGGVISWLLDTHPEAVKILGKEAKDGSEGEAGTN